MHLSEISVKKPVAIGMFFIGMILLGLVSLSRLSVDLLPDLAYPKLTIWTTYRDVAAGAGGVYHPTGGGGSDYGTGRTLMSN